MGDTPHSIVQQALQMVLGIHAKAWNIHVLPTHRVQVAEERWLLPDLCVFSSDRPLREAVQKPPLICVEVVSPEDGLSEMHEKVENYIEAGVQIVWIIDPRLRKAYETVVGLNTVSVLHLTVPGTDIIVYSTEIFDALDEYDPDAYRASVRNKEA